MTSYSLKDTSQLGDAYAAYFKATVATGNQMPLGYERWLEQEFLKQKDALEAAQSRIAALEARVNAAMAIEAADPAYYLTTTMGEYVALGYNAARDEFRSRLSENGGGE